MTDVALLALLTLVASAVGTLSGFGTSTIMVPLLTLFFPLPVTLLFVGIIQAPEGSARRPASAPSDEPSLTAGRPRPRRPRSGAGASAR